MSALSATQPPQRLTSLEISTSVLVGPEPGREPLQADPVRRGARAALEAAIVPALEREPCVVSFSGGRDSSAVLALAVTIARRAGLADPVPVSLRFPRVESADEADWQEQVIRHLGLKEWDRHYFADQMDALGPFARDVMERHGLLFPFNVHFHLPIFERAAGGSLLTGVGGDEVLLPSDWVRVNQLRAGLARPRPSDMVRLAAAYAPLPCRAAWYRQRSTGSSMPWLTPDAQHTLVRSWSRSLAGEPLEWDRWLREAWWPNRQRIAGEASLRRLAAAADVLLVQPIEDPAFLSALADEQGAAGFRNREHAMQSLFGDVLPTALIDRRSKSWFDGAFLTSDGRSFAASWDGGGVDPAVVDIDALRRMWQSDDINLRTLLLLQHVWLQARRRRPVPPSPRRPHVVALGPVTEPPPPTFFLVGAAKAGTSALHAALRQHPDIWMGRLKEPHYFAWLANRDLVGDLYTSPQQAAARYASFYEGVSDAALVGDCSTSALVIPGTAGLIRAAAPKARIVMLLREPAQRAFSHFIHFLAAGAESTRDFNAALRTPEERVKLGLSFAYDYLGWGRYGEQLASYLDVFPREQIHVELYEDFVADPGATVARVLRFLGTSTDVPVLRRRVNEVRLPRWPVAYDLLYGRSRTGRRLARLVPTPQLVAVREQLRPRMTTRPLLDHRARARIVGELANDIRRLEDLLGRDLARWRTP